VLAGQGLRLVQREARAGRCRGGPRGERLGRMGQVGEQEARDDQIGTIDGHGRATSATMNSSPVWR
jgi:hypothetical protein